MAKALARPPVLFKPIQVGGFTLTATGLEVRGRPGFDEYQGVGEFIKKTHQASGFWLGDWLRYGDDREDWRAKLSQAQDATGLSEKTLKQVRAIARGLPASRRRDDLEFSVQSEIAWLPPDEQNLWLEKAHANGWDRRELRLEIKASRRRTVIEGQAVLEGMYRIIYADNPWPYGDRMPSGSSAERHYPTMTIAEMCKLPVGAHAMPDSVLFMWTTAPTILQNPGPREVGEAWGFTYKQQWIWDKVDRNVGHYSDGNHEILTIWTRGSCLPDVPTDLPDSVVTVRKSREHSAKPDEFRRLIMKHWTMGPYLELFGRTPVEGWSVFGNDARLWAQDAAGV